MNISFPAHGLNDLGCCAYSEFGCCPDDLEVASGPYGKAIYFSLKIVCLFCCDT